MNRKRLIETSLQKKYSSIYKIAVLFASFIILVFFSGCIELKPREGISTKVQVTITKGSDVCVGYNESICGAFLKEKRIATSDYVCKGPLGPENKKIENYTYKLDIDSGWTCEELGQEHIFYAVISKNLRSATYSLSTYCNGYKNWYGKCKQSGPCPVGRKGPYIFTINRNITTQIPVIEGLNNVVADCSGTISGGINGRLDHSISLICGSGTITDPFVLPSLTTTGRCGGVRTPQSDRFSCLYSVPPQSKYINLNVQTFLTETLNECGRGDCGGWDIGINYEFICNIIGEFKGKFKCKNDYTNEVYYYANCSYDTFSTFQGGRTLLDSNVSFSKLSSYIQSYYGNYKYNPFSQEIQPAGNIQVPFFMLGQGPSFQDYEEAKKLCVPWKETIVNVSLGNTTFDPPFLIIPERLELCFDNQDKVQHKVDIVDSTDQSLVREITLLPKRSTCYIPFKGIYKIKDSNGDSAYLYVTEQDNTQIYVGRNLIPNYTIVNEGGFVNFSLIERNEHSLKINSINRFDDYFYENNISLNISNPIQTIRTPKAGEYKISDTSTGKTGYLFVQSPVKRFIFKSETVDPNYEIYRPLGDSICFKSEKEGLNISIYRYTEKESGYEWVWLTNESLSTVSFCCMEGLLPGKYQGITTDGRVVNWTIGTGKPSATITIQPIGFEPEVLDSTPGTKICWINPSAIPRNIITKSSIGKTFFSGQIPPLSDNVCWPTMNKTDSYVTTFIPQLGVRNVINIKETDSRLIQILPGGKGFDVLSLVVRPGSQVCWVNSDNNNHTLKDERGNFIVLAPSQTNCIDKNTAIEGNIYTRQLDGTDIYSEVGIVDGKGLILGPRGPLPKYLFVDPPVRNMTLTGDMYIVTPSYFKIINKQNIPSELYEISYVKLTSNTTGLANIVQTGNDTILINSQIKSYTKLMLYLHNSDTKNHTIRVEEKGDEVIIPSNSIYLFEINKNTLLTDLTIKENLTNSGLNNQTIINALSQIPIIILGPSEIKLNRSGLNGDSLILTAPIESHTAILYENNTNNTIIITFTSTEETIFENPLNNLTLDLPTQLVHGDLSSQTLYDMRKYADEGAMSLIIPSFKNVTVKIHSSIFSPSEVFIPAGSTITFTNKDTIDHEIYLQKNESGVLTSRSFVLSPLQSNYTYDTSKNTTFSFYDRNSNMKGNVTTVAYDANIGIVSTPIYPELGMVIVKGPVKFNNYENSDVKVEIKLRDESNVEYIYNLVIPKYNNGFPGIAIWTPDKAGNATYTVKMNNDIIGTGKIVIRNSIINVSIINGYFELKSLAIDHNSKVCLNPNSPRKISITNLDTGEKITERFIYPLEAQVDDIGGLCKKVYNCSAKQKGVECSGVLNESDPSSYCSYSFTEAESVCKLNNNITCVVKDIYSKDLECATDYSKDLQPNVPGIQPQCLFQARLNGEACNGGADVKHISLASIINCSVSNTGLLQFSYLPGKEKTNVSNLLCNVEKKANSISCTPTGVYSDIGCVRGEDVNFCYLTPPPPLSGKTTSTNQYCIVNSMSRSYEHSIKITDVGDVCRNPSQWGRGITSDGCIFLTDEGCGSGMSHYSCPTYRECHNGVCTTYSDAVNRKRITDYIKLSTECSLSNNKCKPNFAFVTSDGCGSGKGPCVGPVDTVCKGTITNVLSTQPNKGGSTINNYPIECLISSESINVGCFGTESMTVAKFSKKEDLQYPYICSNESSCPCKTTCGKKVNYSNLGNINCVQTPLGCNIVTNYNLDDGTYCNYNYSITCVPKEGYEDKVYCGFNGSSCTLSNTKKLRDDGFYCNLNLFSCESPYEGIICSFNSLTQSCKVENLDQFCFTPTSTYLVQDLDSKDTLVIEGYDRYQPLNIYIQRSEFTPSFVTTSPLSDVCLTSLDGKSHIITVPEQINSSGNILVSPGSTTCLKFPFNPEPWIIRLRDKMDTSAGIKSIKQDVEIIVKSQMFEPSDLILRTNTSITFINTDPEPRTLNKASPSLSLGKLLLNQDILLSDPLFYNIFRASWIDKIECNSDSDCPEGSFCDVEKRCHPIKLCLTDSDCGSENSVCSNNRCVLVKSCVNNDQCDLGFVCINGRCTALLRNCTKSSDCGFITNGSVACINNKCTALKSCDSSSDCGQDMICVNKLCSIPNRCSNNSDCPLGSICYEGKCTVPKITMCNPSQPNCPEGFSCIEVDEDESVSTYACVLGGIERNCSSNSNCTEETVCITNRILETPQCMLYNTSSTICEFDEDCEDGACINGLCINSKKCTVDSDCGVINGIQLICDGYCKMPSRCISSLDCKVNESCEDGYCRIKSIKDCAEDSDCNSDEVCYSMKCIKKQDCTSTDQCNRLQSGGVCTNSSTQFKFCILSTNCTSDGFCGSNQYCDLGLNQCISYPKTTCDSPLFGKDVTETNVSFKLPPSTYKVYLIYSFNDNGKIKLNGQTILSTTRFRCEYKTSTGTVYVDQYSKPVQWKIPLGLLKTGSEENNMSITLCSCSGEKGFNISILYYYVSPEGVKKESITIEPNSKLTVYSPEVPEEFVFIENKTLNALPVSVRSVKRSDGVIDCSYDLSSIALGISSYERLDYATKVCDAGKLKECASYNPYGPATVAFVSSEATLNLSDPSERLCAFQQLASVKTICPNCTTVLNVGSVNITELADILSSANSTIILNNRSIDYIDVIGYDEFLNEYSSCSFEDIMNSIVNKSKLSLYNYSKPSLIMRFALKEGTSNVNLKCNWTSESIIEAYNDFYGLWIPILAGSGILGVSQYCLTDPCPSLDFYGLLTSGKTKKQWTDAWFREGCGRYYYAAEGLSFTTFSMKETNYSMCDPSKILALLQTSQCAVGKYTLKSGK